MHKLYKYPIDLAKTLDVDDLWVGYFPVVTAVLDIMPLRWRHNGWDGVSNHQPHDCLLNRLFGRRSKKILKLRVTGLCAGNSPVIGEFPAQMVSCAENVSIWWRHHVISLFYVFWWVAQSSYCYCVPLIDEVSTNPLGRATTLMSVRPIQTIVYCFKASSIQLIAINQQLINTHQDVEPLKPWDVYMFQ